MNDDVKVLVGCTGSVASIKVPTLVEGLLGDQLKLPPSSVRVVATFRSLHFFNVEEVKGLQVEVVTDEGDSSFSPEDLASWADVFLIAPLDANTLAKISHGLADNILSSVVRHWDVRKPLLFAPAMNTAMWDHPLTSEQTSILRDFGFLEIPPVEKTLVCGDKGTGAMAEVADILNAMRNINETKKNP